MGGRMLKWAGKVLALRTPRAMECVCGDRKDTLSTTTAFTTMRMVTTRRKVRYLSGWGGQELAAHTMMLPPPLVAAPVRPPELRMLGWMEGKRAMQEAIVLPRRESGVGGWA